MMLVTAVYAFAVNTMAWLLLRAVRDMTPHDRTECILLRFLSWTVVVLAGLSGGAMLAAALR